MRHDSVGLIGFGMTGKVHAYAYTTLPYYMNSTVGEFRITHVATAHAATAEKAKQITRAEYATTDFRTITENPAVDIVHICTPNEGHLEPLLSAIAHGKHIYCEKPLCVNADEARVILRAIEESGYSATNQMTFHLRFFPAIQRLKQLLLEGRLGRILQFRAAFLHSSSASPEVPFKWKHSESGGVIRDLGSHVLDLIDDLLGPFESLLAETQIAHPRRPVALSTPENPHPAMVDVTVEDAVSLLVRMRSGARGVIEATKLASGSEDELRLEIHGEKGAARFSLMQPHYLEFFDATVPQKPLGGMSGWTAIACGGRFEPPDSDFPSPKSSLGWIRAHVASLSNFLQAVAEGKPTQPDLRQGAKIQELMQTIADSARQRIEDRG